MRSIYLHSKTYQWTARGIFREEKARSLRILVVVCNTFVVATRRRNFRDRRVPGVWINFVAPPAAAVFFTRDPRVPPSHSSTAVARGSRQNSFVPNDIARRIEPQSSNSSVSTANLAVAHVVPPSVGWVRDHASSICVRVHSIAGFRTISKLNLRSTGCEFLALQPSRENKSVTWHGQFSRHICCGRTRRLFGGIGGWVWSWVGVGGWVWSWVGGRPRLMMQTIG